LPADVTHGKTTQEKKKGKSNFLNRCPEKEIIDMAFIHQKKRYNSLEIILQDLMGIKMVNGKKYPKTQNKKSGRYLGLHPIEIPSGGLNLILLDGVSLNGS
jgi:hypothetical protein